MDARRLTRTLTANSTAAFAHEDRLASVIETAFRAEAARVARRFKQKTTQPVPLSAAAPAADSAMVALYPTAEQAVALRQPNGEPVEILHLTLCFLGEIPLDVAERAYAALRPVAEGFGPLEGVVGGVGTFGNLLADLAVVAQRYAPDGGYGDTGWYAQEETVLWIPADWTTSDEVEEAERAFLAIEGVERVVIEDAESALPDDPDFLTPVFVNGKATVAIEYPSIVLPDIPGLPELRDAIVEALDAAGIEYATNHGFTPHITVAYTPEPSPPPTGLIGMPLSFDAVFVTRGDVPREIPLGQPLVAAGPPAGWTPPHPDELLDVDAFSQYLRGKMDPVRRATIDDLGKGLPIDWNVTHPLAGRVLARSASQVTNVAETTQLNVMRSIRKAHEEGFSIRDTSKLIQAGMVAASPARAALIARTELAAVVNGGSLAATQAVSTELGIVYYKEWLTAPGAEHPRHEDYDGLDGQTVALDEFFDVGGTSLQYPGDPDGPPEEICNCRCTMAYTEDANAGIGGTDPTAIEVDPEAGSFVPPDDTAPPVDVVDSAAAAGKAAVDGLRESLARDESRPPSDPGELDKAEKNFTKLFRGRIVSDEKTVAAVRAAADYNATSPLYRSALRSFGQERVAVINYSEKASLIDPGRDVAAAHRLTGNRLTVVREEAVRDLAAAPEAIASGDTASTTRGSFAALLRHEYGHQIESSLTPQQWTEFRALLPQPERVKAELTSYASSNLSVGNAQEAFSELYAVVSDPAYDPAAWPEWVQEAGRYVETIARAGEELPVAAAPADALARDIEQIRARAEWIGPGDAARLAAERSANGYDPHYYPEQGIAGYLRDQQSAAIAAGKRIDEEIAASIPSDLTVAREMAVENEEKILRLRKAELGPLEKESEDLYRRMVSEPDDAIWKDLRDRYTAINERHREMTLRWRDAEVEAKKATANARGAELVAERDAMLKALQRVREFGRPGEEKLSYAEGSQAEAKPILDEATNYLPREWVEKMREMKVSTGGRGSHLNARTPVVKVSTRKRSLVPTDTGGLSSAIHELGHEIEANNPTLVRLEAAFYKWRTSGRSFDGKQERVRLLKSLKPGHGYSAKEKTRPDDFSDPYTGKFYDGRNYEILTTGLEGLFTGSFDLDPEWRQFLLGMLALL